MKAIYTTVYLCVLSVITFASTTAFARPVSYPGGVTVMQMNNAESNNVHIHYSPTARYSIGYKGEYWRDGSWQFHGAQVNILGKRWNKPASQANFYIKTGAGLAYSDAKGFRDKVEPAAFTGIALDWENRRVFTSYENRVTYAGDIDKFFMQKARIGFAPYLGDYGDVHTWLMLQADHNPQQDDPVTVTPLVRFFKGVYMTEIGMSNKKDAMFNFVMRF